jgi:hypothetical protein
MLAAIGLSSAALAAEPTLLPERFFIGRTEGTGTLKVVLKRAQAVKVQSVGRMEGDVLVLDQIVRIEGEEPERRQWRMRKLAAGRYTGTASDAIGPISGEIAGSQLHLKYRMKKDKVDVEQWIALQPDGRTAVNRMTLRKLGLKVGTLNETIRRLD